MRVDATGARAQVPVEPERAAAGRLAAAALGGDWFSDCMGLIACGSAEQYCAQRRHVQRGHRAMQLYKQRLEELRVEQEKRAAKARRWGCLSSVIAVVTTVVGTVVSLYCAPLGRAISVGGASLAASFGVVGRSYGDKAAEGHCRTMKMAGLKADAAADAAESLQMLNDMVVAEQAMGRRLMNLLESERQIAEAAMRTGG